MLELLKFDALLFEKIWGGQVLKGIFNEKKLKNIGEAWLLSGVEGKETSVKNGALASNNISELSEIFMSDLLGDDVFVKFGEDFPLLLKLIDTSDNLSIQVHPNGDFCEKNPQYASKNEAWYILDAANDAEIWLGFKEDTQASELLSAIENNNLPDLLNRIKVKKGDFFFIPAGTIHGIGKNITLAEIQESSDTTFRIWDWNRVDENGQGRSLHLKEAINSLDYNEFPTNISNQADDVLPLNTPFFNIDIFRLIKHIDLDYSDIDSFVCLICIDGEANIHCESNEVEIKTGEVVLVPAGIENIHIHPNPKATFLEVYLSL